MENRPDISVMESEDSFAVIPVDQGELGQNSDDALYRRLKNRERQRRYRERKRLETDRKKAESSVNNSASPHGHVEVNWALDGGETRIFCRRNWKQDARRAHVAKQRRTVANDGLSVKFENNVGNFVDEDVIDRKVVPGRRHWKADARNKKD